MYRVAPARSVFPVLTVALAALIALQILTSAVSFTSAHTARHAVANAQSETKLSGAASRDEFALCHGSGPAGDPIVPLRTRDRQRTSAVPEAPRRPAPTHPLSTAPRPAAPAPADLRTVRPSRAHSTAALQVFRC